MKKFIYVWGLFLIVLSAKAQETERAIGIRGGLSSGFEYRVFTNDSQSYKALLSTRNNGLQIVGMKEFHNYGVFSSNQLDFIYGFGLHVGYERWDRYKNENTYTYWETKTAPLVGLDGLVGLEYNFLEVPINIGFEVKPFFDVFGREDIRVQPFDFAFTLKYNF